MSTNQSVMKVTKLENRLTIIIFVIISCFMIKGLVNTCDFNQTIEENKYATIAKVVKFEYYPRGASETHYTYYYNQKKFATFERIGSSNQNYVGRFFVVSLSTKKPQNSLINLNQEVTDSTEIINAGFRRE